MSKLKRIPITAARIALTAWAMGSAALWIAQDGLIFPAPRQSLGTPALAGWPMFQAEELTTADGFRLDFWAVRPRAGKPTVIVFHGNGAQASWGAPYLGELAERHGFGLILAEYRGYSGNPGAASEAGLIEDARAYARWAAEQWGVELPVLLGESLGTGVAIALASEIPTRGVVLDSPFSSIADVVSSGPFFWAPTALIRHRFDSRSRMPRIRSPVMVVHGTADQVIPVAQGREILSLAPCPGPGVFPEGVAHTALANDRSGAGRDAVVEFIGSLSEDGGCPAR